MIAAAPLAPLRYHRLLGALPRYRWWKPLVAVLVAAVLWIVFQVVVVVAALAVAVGVGRVRFDSLTHLQADLTALTTLDAADLLSLLLALGAVVTLLPAVWLGYLAVGLRPLGVLRSVAFRVRWRWLAACLVPALVVTVIASAAGLWLLPLWLGGWPIAPTTPIGTWVACAAAIIVVTPIQAAAEEFAFRGMLSQMLGSWVRWVPVTIVLSAVPFVLLHAYQFWGLLDVGFFALTAGFVTWRTGGLEAGIALHAVNNTVAFLLLASGVYGTTANSSDSGDPISLGVTIVTMGAYALWIDRMARRRAVKDVLDPLPRPE